MNYGSRQVDNFSGIGSETDARDNFMLATGEHAEHSQRIIGIARLFEDMLVNYDDGVRRQYQLAGIHENGKGLLLSQTAHIIFRRFMRTVLLWNVGGADHEWNSRGCQDLLPPQRSGC